jgi:hypothetical protein
MNDSVSRWLGVVRCVALLLLVLAALVVPTRADKVPCNVCQCMPGTDICNCRGALTGEEGWTGACTETGHGCAFGLGEACTPKID